jgi:hypothetical protein
MRLPWQIDSYISGILLVVIATTVAVLGLLLSRRVLRKHDLISTHEVGGFLLSVVGTMYAVILGLIVVDSLVKFQQGRLMTEQEANGLANIVLLANHMPSGTREQIQKYALEYADLVVNREWLLLDDGLSSPEAQEKALQLIETVTEFEPKTAREQSTYETALAAAGDFWNARRYRVVTAAQGIPALQWFVLIAGGGITVTFTYFFKLEHLRIQVVMTSLVATIIALSLYMLLMFGYPYSGGVKVSCDSFSLTQAIVTRHNPDHPSLPRPATGSPSPAPTN